LHDDAGEVMLSGKPQQQRSERSAEDLLRQTELTREALEWWQPGPSNTITTSGPPQTAPAPNTGTRQSARLQQQNLRALSAAEQVRLYELDHAVDVGNWPFCVMVLFSGGGSVEKAIHVLYPNNRLGIVAVDSCPKSSATIVADINKFAQTQLFDWNPGYFDILWASPPCTEYRYAKSKSKFNLAEWLFRTLLSLGNRVQISSWSLRLRFNLSFRKNRGNYHGYSCGGTSSSGGSAWRRLP
jgi:hypothetical protein